MSEMNKHMTKKQKYKNTTKKYKNKFSMKQEKALEHALDIRKFEIELYWKRATYFWALIAVAFVGFFTVLSSKGISESGMKETYVFIIGCIGLLFTWAWFLVNKGSKYWQENWENHVNMLEDDVIGPLYKTTLERPNGDGLAERLITGPAKLSVSKINQWVSFFTILVWLGLMASIFDWTFSKPYFCLQVPAAILVLVFICITYMGSSSHHGNHQHVMNTRKTLVLKKKD